MGNKSSKKEHRPAAMDDLLQTTLFTEEEILSWYKNFLKVGSVYVRSPVLYGYL